MNWFLVLSALVAMSFCSDEMSLEDKKVENALFAMVGEEVPHDIPLDHHNPGLHDKLVTKAKNITLGVKDNAKSVTERSDHEEHSAHGAHGAHEGHDHHKQHQSNHENHNGHEAHDHSAHTGAHHDHSAHIMMMWFHGGCKEVILFDFWRIESCCGLVISCAIIFVMGALYEGLKWFRVYLTLFKTNTIKKDTLPMITQNKPLVNANSRSTTPQASRPGPFSLMRNVQALLYVVQLVLAYWLMLIVMTYNTWLTIAVILGAGFGHWLFAALRFANPSGEAADCIATDACH